ncbi:hypothetical protein LEMLEM_LOCUS21002, partial [Lemmus lemmus]
MNYTQVWRLYTRDTSSLASWEPEVQTQGANWVGWLVQLLRRKTSLTLSSCWVLLEALGHIYDLSFT